MTQDRSNKQTLAAAAFAVFAVVCLIAFLAGRTADIWQLQILAGNLGGGPLIGAEGIWQSAAGSIFAVLIGVAWFGLGSFVSFLIPATRSANHSHVLELASKIAIGSAFWSLIWFFLGLAGAYSGTTAVATLVIGLVLAGLNVSRIREAKSESRVPERAGAFDKALLLLIAVPVVLALISAAAPPTAKDSLLYHLSVPKAFIAQGSNTFVEGNIASYLALGTEMHIVWARLLGGIFSERTAEVAGTIVVWLFFPLLLASIFGWARETGISRRWSLIAVLMAASVPTAYHVASSGYIDIALALYITLAIYSLCRWWGQPSNATASAIAIFLGAGLGVKMTTVFVIAAFALVVLLRARNAADTGKIIATGFGSLILAGAIASPTYIRTWAVTGSPVFPFYMSIWPGTAAGWDVERSNLFQGMNAQYGGAESNKANYLTAPVRVSVMAQPEEPANYDGVLGVAFLIGLPLLIWALWKLEIPTEAKIAAGVAGVMYLFWLFSSAQLRYLLPIVPALAIAIAASVEAFGDKLRGIAQYAFAASALAATLTAVAWFCQKAPLRVVLGGETRDEYLTRNLDYYPFYQAVDTDTPKDSSVWLINMRRDTYNIERSVYSDYLFEDWTLRTLVWDSANIGEARAKAKALGVQYILTRYDFLFNYDRSTLVDDKKPRSENESKLKMAKDLLLDPAATIKSDNKFSLVRLGA
ncbi:MAG TPA: glycosyltransferase family 39 protein [Pyrinomonadaceae bacterium]|nr:glycosyltransferase family 39 protein [Chloracidobacterium sp.]MBP9935359.1 glycosyltransferase family 39 protein [Pyrinomonadaceae bacterium]MBL0241296.1 glycosyltransferase family 39 protein [Chloracidobacterium sp.]HQX54976.1 glycosyltransferase family 39 protein [Pyrinomonadaceae bacterium]HQY66694.1 glycosyltransferase family 39 protein [Pyrinomonadaceae bacterium]